jgi:hypothetical protein
MGNERWIRRGRLLYYRSSTVGDQSKNNRILSLIIIDGVVAVLGDRVGNAI